MLSSWERLHEVHGHRLALRPGQAVPELNLDRAVAVVPQADPELVVEDLVAPLHRARLLDQPPADLELGIDAEAGEERLAGGHQRQAHPAHEVAPDVDRRLAGQEHEVALVGELRQAIDTRSQHRRGLGVVLGGELDPGHLEQLGIVPRGDVERARDRERDAGPVLRAGVRGLGRALAARHPQLRGLTRGGRPVEQDATGRLHPLQGQAHAAEAASHPAHAAAHAAHAGCSGPPRDRSSAWSADSCEVIVSRPSFTR